MNILGNAIVITFLIIYGIIILSLLITILNFILPPIVKFIINCFNLIVGIAIGMFIVIFIIGGFELSNAIRKWYGIPQKNIKGGDNTSKMSKQQIKRYYKKHTPN